MPWRSCERKSLQMAISSRLVRSCGVKGIEGDEDVDMGEDEDEDEDEEEQDNDRDGTLDV
jgi:hypothetical protein